MEGVEEVGKKAYQKQMWGAYEEAVTLYTNAIKKFPNDSRLLNNRCMCYIELNEYRKALDDAENMTLLFSNNKKSYFRKGEVLMHMKEYSKAEAAFKDVLMIDPICEDAIRQKLEVQTQQLLKRVKHNKRQIQRALNMTGNVEDAERVLKSGAFDSLYEELENVVYYSDEENYEGSTVQEEYDPLTDPTNPLGCTSLWVGNLTKAVTEQVLKELFSKYGRIKSMKTKLESQYAFINFHDSVGPAKAMKNLQGSTVCGKSIIIKYPDNATTTTTAKKAVKSK